MTDHIPFVRGSDTSEEAAALKEPTAESDSRRVYEHIAKVQHGGLIGATCDEIEAALKMRHQNVSARIRGLALMGFVKDSGQRRKTRSGRMAVIWEVGKGPKEAVPSAPARMERRRAIEEAASFLEEHSKLSLFCTDQATMLRLAANLRRWR